MNAPANHGNRILSIRENFLHQPFDASASRDLRRDWQRIFLGHIPDAFAGCEDDSERFARRLIGSVSDELDDNAGFDARLDRAPMSIQMNSGNQKVEREVRVGAPSSCVPGAPLIVDYAPQIELLRRAAITICHGGANTVLESLACGVPVIAIPITNDQPGMGARLNRSGAGEMVLLRNLSARRLRSVIESVLTHPAYRLAATLHGESIRKAGGAARAADII